MIVLDVNVVVYAYRREAEHHDRYASWLSELVAGRDDIGLVESTLIGFARIVTNRRIVGDPAPMGETLAFLDVLRRAPRARAIAASAATWDAFSEIVDADPAVQGNLVPDAWLAALAISNGCRLATADRGFARFAGLDWFDPARP